jgi:hypothetical protein
VRTSRNWPCGRITGYTEVIRFFLFGDNSGRGITVRVACGTISQHSWKWASLYQSALDEDSTENTNAFLAQRRSIERDGRPPLSEGSPEIHLHLRHLAVGHPHVLRHDRTRMVSPPYPFGRALARIMADLFSRIVVPWGICVRLDAMAQNRASRLAPLPTMTAPL